MATKLRMAAKLQMATKLQTARHKAGPFRFVEL